MPRNTGRTISRRSWLAGAAACASASAGAWARAEDPPGPDEEQRAVFALGEKAGLPRFRSSETPHYLAIGDARDDFRARTLRDCERVRADYLDHYQAKGFDVVAPEQRLTVVTLANARSFEAYLPKEEYMRNPEWTLHGVYHLGTNRLVVFDHRGPASQRGPGGARLDTSARSPTRRPIN